MADPYARPPMQAAWPAPVQPMGPPASSWPAPGQPMPPPTNNYGFTNSPIPSDPGSCRAIVPTQVPCNKPIDSTWYTRVDYFHWNERIGSLDFVNESGALYTVGYTRRFGSERFRAELFGGRMNYDGYGQFDDGSLEPLDSHTRYLGARAEMEMLIEPEGWSDGHFLLGVGSRFWIRDIQSGMTSTSGTPVLGYEEDWWTIYPYLGMETWRPLGDQFRFYTSARVGVTAFTYARPSLLYEPLYPRPGFIGQVEMGVRGPHFELSAYFEAMTFARSLTMTDWSQDPPVDNMQPESRMYTIGGRLGYTF